MTKPTQPRIALIAHDKKKDDMIKLAGEYREFLQACILSATGTTGGRLINELGLNVERMHSGPVGGDLQIGAQLVNGQIDCVIFLRDQCLDRAPGAVAAAGRIRQVKQKESPCAPKRSGSPPTAVPK